MSRMHNPAHPGEVLREWIPEDMTITSAAQALNRDFPLGVNPATTGIPPFEKGGGQ